MKNKIIAALAALIVCLSGVTAFANYDESADYSEDAGAYEGYSDTYDGSDEADYTDSGTDEYSDVFSENGFTDTSEASETSDSAEPEQSGRTISTAGNGHIVDDITDSEYLQFITVTARDGNVFYVVIDRQNSNDNVYFLNTVDESDIAALVEDYTPQTEPTPAPSMVSPSPDETPQPEEKPVAGLPSGISGNMVIVILALAGIGGLAGYYFKIYLPKKKLEDADDIDDYEFGSDNDEENEVEDDFYSGEDNENE